VCHEGKVGPTRRELDAWITTLPQPRMIGMQATIFTGWIYDHLLPHAEKVKVAHPLMLRAIAAAKRNAARTTGTIARRCSRLANSGTTPPNRACVAICEATTEDSVRAPRSTTAAAVSSHELSIPRIRPLGLTARFQSGA
jgi:hypothetical protein